jgi:hypothetical protein
MSSPKVEEAHEGPVLPNELILAVMAACSDRCTLFEVGLRGKKKI